MQLYFKIAYAVALKPLKKQTFTSMFHMRNQRCIRKKLQTCLLGIPDLNFELLRCPKLRTQMRGKTWRAKKHPRDFLMGYLFLMKCFETINTHIVSIKMNSYIHFLNFPPFSI